VNTLAKIILFPVYAPYKLIKGMTGKKVPESVMEEVKSDTAQRLMDYGLKPEEAFKLSKEFWEKNKDKLMEVVKY
jgi:hypothetical protein